MKPFEIIAAPFTVWIAPQGEAFPDLDNAPSGNWAKLGTSGDKNITEDGVTVSHPQAIEVFRGVGCPAPLKAWRTEEDLMVSFALADISLEQYAKALNDNSVTDTAAGSGTVGVRDINLERGLALTEYSLLVRSETATPYQATGKTQYQIPRVIEEGEPEVVFVKGEPAALEMTFRALFDPDAAAGEGFGKLLAQDADALP